MRFNFHPLKIMSFVTEICIECQKFCFDVQAISEVLHQRYHTKKYFKLFYHKSNSYQSVIFELSISICSNIYYLKINDENKNNPNKIIVCLKMLHINSIIMVLF